MNITADAVRQLRERTGAGMMECKKALVETKGDLDAAAELMRRQGLAKADRKAARVAAEGVIVIERSADARAAFLRGLPASSSSTNSSSPTATWGTASLPSSTASAMPAAYSWIARMASSLPGIT